MAFLFSPGCDCCQTEAPSGPSGSCFLCDNLISLPAPSIIVNLSGWTFPPLNDNHLLAAVTNDDPFSLQWIKTFCSLGVLDPDCFDAGEPFPQYFYSVTFYIKFATSRIGLACPNTIQHRCYLRVTLNYHDDNEGDIVSCSWTCLFVLQNGSWVLLESTNSGEDCAAVDPEAQPACGTITDIAPDECCTYFWVAATENWELVNPDLSECCDPDCEAICHPPVLPGDFDGQFRQGGLECVCDCVCEAMWQWSAPDPENPQNGSWVFIGSDPELCCDIDDGAPEPSFPGTFDGQIAFTCCDDFN